MSLRDRIHALKLYKGLVTETPRMDALFRGSPSLILVTMPQAEAILVGDAHSPELMITTVLCK